VISQRGFTLLELLAALGLVAVVATLAASAVFHLVRSNNIVLQRLQDQHSLDMAGRWISRDAKMAEVSDLVDGAPPVSSLELYRTDRYIPGPLTHTTIYSLTGSDIQRDYDGQINIIARDISTADFSLQGQTVIITLNASGEQRTYRVLLRPN